MKKHGGRRDHPRFCAIKVKAKTAHYAISNQTMVGGMIEFAKSVAIGEVPSVNKLRHLRREEFSYWCSK